MHAAPLAPLLSGRLPSASAPHAPAASHPTTPSHPSTRTPHPSPTPTPYPPGSALHAAGSCPPRQGASAWDPPWWRGWPCLAGACCWRAWPTGRSSSGRATRVGGVGLSAGERVGGLGARPGQGGWLGWLAAGTGSGSARPATKAASGCDSVAAERVPFHLDMRPIQWGARPPGCRAANRCASSGPRPLGLPQALRPPSLPPAEPACSQCWALHGACGPVCLEPLPQLLCELIRCVFCESQSLCVCMRLK